MRLLEYFNTSENKDHLEINSLMSKIIILRQAGNETKNRYTGTRPVKHPLRTQVDHNQNYNQNYNWNYNWNYHWNYNPSYYSRIHGIKLQISHTHTFRTVFIGWGR